TRSLPQRGRSPEMTRTPEGDPASASSLGLRCRLLRVAPPSPAEPSESEKARGDQYDASGCGNTRRARRGGRGPAEATVADPDVACERSRLVALVSVQ